MPSLGCVLGLVGVVAARSQVTATLSPVGAGICAPFSVAWLLHFTVWGLEGIGPWLVATGLPVSGLCVAASVWQRDFSRARGVRSWTRALPGAQA